MESYTKWRGNELEKIFLEYPHEWWDWIGLSLNESLTLKMLRMNKPWLFNLVSNRKFITKDIINEFKDRSWDKRALWDNSSLSNEDLKSLGIDYGYRRFNREDIGFKDRNIKEIRENNEWAGLGYQISYCDMNGLIREWIDEMDLNINILSSNSTITTKFIEDNVDLPWNWLRISENKCIDIQFVKKYKERLDWNRVSENGGIRMEDIEDNLDLPWNWRSISANPNLTLNMLKKYKEKEWYFLLISENKFLYDEESLNINMVRDIEKRRGKVLLGFYDDLNDIIKLYIGYA